MTHFFIAQFCSVCSPEQECFQECLKAGMECIDLSSVAAGSMLEGQQRRVPSHQISDGSWVRQAAGVVIFFVRLDPVHFLADVVRGD